MADPLSTIVDLEITQQSVGLTAAGFGVMMILSANAAFPERVRYYSDETDAFNDGWAITSPEYLAIAAAKSQEISPPTVGIGRANGAKPTQQYAIGISAVRASHAYRLRVKGQGVTKTDIAATTGGSTSQPAISLALETALNAVAGKNFTAAFAPLIWTDTVFTADHTVPALTIAAHGLETGDGPLELTNSGGALPAGLAAATPYYIIRLDANTFLLATSLALAIAGTAVAITGNGTGTQTLVHQSSQFSPFAGLIVMANAAGDWFSIELLDGVLDMTIAQVHADPGIAAELNAIALADSNWYVIHTIYNSTDFCEGVAGWIAGVKKLYIFDVNETNAIANDVTDDGSSDTCDVMHNLAYGRVAAGYHPDPSAMFSAAWYGRVLPIDPGSETWSLKILQGVAPVALTTDQQQHLVNKHANSIWTVAQENITFNGMTADGDFLDVQRGLDWIDDDMSKGVFGALIAADKVPYTPPGIAIIGSEVKSSLKRAVKRGILSDNPNKPVVILPDFSTITSDQRATRILDDVEFSGTLAGAIHKVNIRGNVSA